MGAWSGLSVDMLQDDKMWIASWQEKVNGAYKYVYPAASASLKQRSDLAKVCLSHVCTLRTARPNSVCSPVRLVRQGARVAVQDRSDPKELREDALLEGQEGTAVGVCDVDG